MYVITQAGAVRCGVIRTKYLYRRPFPGGDLQDQRNQVGLGLMPFSDVTRTVGAGGIEITQAAVVQVSGLADIFQNMFDGPLACAVRISRRALVGLVNRWVFRCTIDSRRG